VLERNSGIAPDKRASRKLAFFQITVGDRVYHQLWIDRSQRDLSTAIQPAAGQIGFEGNFRVADYPGVIGL
jgi:hypothetical protein